MFLNIRLLNKLSFNSLTGAHLTFWPNDASVKRNVVGEAWDSLLYDCYQWCRDATLSFFLPFWICLYVSFRTKYVRKRTFPILTYAKRILENDMTTGVKRNLSTEVSVESTARVLYSHRLHAVRFSAQKAFPWRFRQFTNEDARGNDAQHTLLARLELFVRAATRAPTEKYEARKYTVHTGNFVTVRCVSY